MCDQDTYQDAIQYERRSGALSRREFSGLAAGAGLASLFSRVANAADTKGTDVEIKTPDGTADAYFVHPATGASPAVLMWPDIYGLRPAFKQMATRLAESGYAVLVINPFYRTKKAPTSSDQGDLSALMPMMASLTPQVIAVDGKALLAWLDTQAAVDKKKKAAITGYCMGGPFTFRVAAQFPDRVGAIGSFHGANLVSDADADSPHKLVAKMKASALVAIADNDDQRQPDAKDKLEAAFTQAKLPHTVKVYKGAMHGWCAIDSKAYNHDAAEDAWSQQLEMFKKALV
jgi:carboxymethylenebutenolidase